MQYRDVDYKCFSSTRRFGVELELSNNVDKPFLRQIIKKVSKIRCRSTAYAESVNNDYWHIKTDSTCGKLGRFLDTGWEIASPVLSGWLDVVHVAGVTNALRVHGVRVNRNCGFHVHVETADFTIPQMGCLLGHWLAVERFILGSLPLSRKLDYCGPLNALYYKLGNPRWKVVKPGCPITLYWYFRRSFEEEDGDTKYRALNIDNYGRWIGGRSKRPTIEFRVGEGTVKRKDVINWIRLYVNFVETVKDKRMPFIAPVTLTEALTHLGLHHDDDKFYILSPGLQKTKTWFLERILRRNALGKRTYNEAKKILNEMWNPIKSY